MRIFDTVFNPMDKNATANEVMAVILHRTAFSVYSIFTLWGILAAIDAIPHIGQGNPYVNFFGFFVAPIAATAAFGALYFPRHGRLEMYAASALVPLIVAYLIFISGNAFAGDIDAIRNLVLNSAHLVLPSAKVVYIYKTLIKNAEDRVR